MAALQYFLQLYLFLKQVGFRWDSHVQPRRWQPLQEPAILRKVATWLDPVFTDEILILEI